MCVFQKKYIPHSILINAHLVGLVGLLSPYKELFMLLTPLNLILSGIVLFYHHKTFNGQFITFSILIFSLGYLVELIGVKSGKIFGEYSYGQTLGIKLFEIPIIMGLNWLNLIYAIGILFHKTKFHLIIKSFLGASALTFLDFFIEPVAIKFDFWTWAEPIVPIQNYVAWFVFSFLFLIIFYLFLFKKENKMAFTFMLVQLSFFFILSFLI